MSIVSQLRRLAQDFEAEAALKRRKAHDLTTIADAKYDAFIRLDMLADKIERKMKDDAAQAMSAGTAKTEGLGGDSPASAVGNADAPKKDHNHDQ